MSAHRLAVLQMTSSFDPQVNAAVIAENVERAAGEGATMLFTPEMSGMLDSNRERASRAIAREEDDRVLAIAREAAARHRIWVELGSLAVLREDGGWANRCLVIDDAGDIAARYDKIHMFDVDLATGESWRESNAYTAGNEVVTVATPLGRLGLSICYDIRFPAIYEALGRRGCELVSIPAAFTVPTGQAHWHVLQRARAIEASAFVIAAAQVGRHADGRATYGHSLVIDPWGETLLDMGGDAPGLGIAEIDMDRLAAVRAQLPSLANRREIAT